MGRQGRLTEKAFHAPLLGLLFVVGTACLLFVTLSVSNHGASRVVLEEDPLDKIADDAISIKKRLSEAGKPFEDHDELDDAVDSISSHGQPKELRWHHSKWVDKDRMEQYRKATNSLSRPSTPISHTTFSPTDHLAAQAGKWLTSEKTKAHLANEAANVLGSYESDLSAKPAVQWSKVGPLKLHPVGSSVNHPSSEVIKQLRGQMEKVKEGIYGGKPVPVWGENSVLPAQAPGAHVLAHSNAAMKYRWMSPYSTYPQPYWGDYDNARDYYDYLSRGSSYHPSDPAVQAYIASIQNTPGQAWANAVSAYVAGKHHLENAHRHFPVDDDHSGVVKIRFDRRVRPAAEEPEEGEHELESARGARVARIESEDGSAPPQQSEEHEEAAGPPGPSVAEEVQAALAPLEAQMAGQADQIAAMQHTLDAMPHHHHQQQQQQHATAVPAGEPHVSVSIPGAITMDRVSLPGGEYSFSFAGAHPAAHSAEPQPLHAASPEPEAGAPAAEEEDDVLDSSAEMDNGVDSDAVKAAAKDLQAQVVDAVESGAAGKKKKGDVADTRAEYDNGVDAAAVKAAAKALQKQVVEEKEAEVRGAAAQGAADASVLDSAEEMDNGVDAKEVRAAAEAMQEAVVKRAGLKARLESKLRSAKGGKGRTGAKKGRTEMLAESMLMPIQIEPDVRDLYNDPIGATAYREEVRRRQPGQEAEYAAHYRHMDDQYNYAVQRPPVSFQGGVGSAAHTLPPGGEQGAWYSNWWRHPDTGSIEKALEEDLGLEDKGKERLIQEGVNVNGWEPGRDREQVRRDHLEGKQMPGGFWEDDGKPAEEPDTSVHLACDSKQRTEPCTAEEKAEEEGEEPEEEEEGADEANEEEGEEGGEEGEEEEESNEAAPEQEEEEEPVWKDPMPLKVLKQDYKKRQQEAAGIKDEDEEEEEGHEEGEEEEEEPEEEPEEEEEEEPLWKDPMPLKKLKKDYETRQQEALHQKQGSEEEEEGEEGEEGEEEAEAKR